jgi:hypothetical protein
VYRCPARADSTWDVDMKMQFIPPFTLIAAVGECCEDLVGAAGESHRWVLSRRSDRLACARDCGESLRADRLKGV